MAAPDINAGAFEFFNEGDAGAFVAPSLTLSDADSANLTGATITMSDPRTGDYLAFTAQNGITGVFNPLTGVLTLSGTATVAQYEAALRSIQFMHAGDANFGNSDNSRTFSWQVTDGVETNTDISTIIINEAGPTAGDDVITNGTPIADFIDGLAGDDEMYGAGGDDYLRGGLGADQMFGGTGNDFYVVDNAGDVADETGGDGIDRVWSSITWTLGAGLEDLTLSAAGGAVNGTGNGSANDITGNDAANTLTGLDGADALRGNGGADILLGGDGSDLLDGGTQDDQLFGGADADDLVGRAGNDLLDGGLGADTMIGGLGNDRYAVSEAGDVIIENPGEGTDTVLSDIDYVLGADLENLTLNGALDIDGTGNGLRNTILGSGGDNVVHAGGEADTVNGFDGDDQLHGEAGADVLGGGADNDDLYGGDGTDTLDGGDGDDVLDGGAAADKLTGGDGADVFRFASAGELAADRILDLDFAEGDTIDLSGVYAGTIAFVGRFTGQAGQAVLSYVAGSDTTYVRIDLDGDKTFDATLVISGDHRGGETNLYEGGGDTDGGWIL